MFLHIFLHQDNTPMLIRFFTVLLLIVSLLTPAQAALTIQGARIIFEESRGEATVHMQYTGSVPALLQVWMDSGTAEGAPGSEDVPFIMLPALTRLEPGMGQSIRILRVGDGGFPADRESVLYFNTLEVPPAPTAQIAANDAYMQFSIKGRLKFFYRPKGLTLKPEKAFEQLQFSLDEPLADGRMQLRIHNPSPYHVTLTTLELRHADDSGAPGTRPLLGFNHYSRAGRMVAPMQELLMPLEWVEAAPGTPLPANLRVDFTVINDAGGMPRLRQALN